MLLRISRKILKKSLRSQCLCGEIDFFPLTYISNSVYGQKNLNERESKYEMVLENW